MSEHSSRRWWSLAIGGIVVVLGLAFVIRRVVSNWDEVSAVLADARLSLMVLAVAVAVAAMWAVGWRWHRTMVLLGGRPTRSASARWFAAGQLGKYVPGGFWHILGQGELARRGGVERSVSYASVGLSTVSLYGTAGGLVVAQRIIPGSLHVSWWAMAGAGALFLGSVEPQVVGRLLRRLKVPTVPGRRQLLALSIGNLVVWSAVSVATVLIAKGLRVPGSTWTILGAAVASWLVGFLALPSPGGLGVREAAFVAMVSGAVPAGVAAAIALVARLVFVVADGLLFAISSTTALRGRSGSRTPDV